MEENRIENEKTALQREERLKAEFETTRERVLQSLMKKEKEEALYQEKLLSFIKEQEVLKFLYKILDVHCHMSIFSYRLHLL